MIELTETPAPHFIVIGAMKCATSTLADQLAAQTGIFMTDPKEPNYFSDDSQWVQGKEWYASLFAGSESTDLCGEASTHYTKLPTYPKTIDRLQQSVSEQTRFIYVMRHPIDRLVSHYIHDWTMNILSMEINEAAVSHAALSEYGCYAEQLAPYLKAFGRERVLPVFFEHMVSHPQAELERICQFLAFQSQPVWKDLAPKNISAQRMRDNAMRELVLNAPILRTIRKRWIPQTWRDRSKKLWQMNKRPQLRPDVEKDLEAYFDNDLAELGAWLGIPNLCCANFKSSVSEGPLEWS